jgi:hypothetical protein
MVLALVRWKHQPMGSSRLPLPRTRRQDAAIDAMHDFVYQTNPLAQPDGDDTYDQALDVVLLELLEAVYYQELRQTESAASVFDIIMIILCLNPDGSFSKASYVTHMCAIHQYMIRATAAHSLRLFKLGMTHYVPLTATRPVVYTPPRIRASPMRTVRSPMESTASPRTVHGLRAES